MTAQRIGTIFAAVITAFSLVPTAAASQTDSVAIDRAMLSYEINRARWGPAAFAARAGDVALPVGTLPAPPLAPNQALASSATFKADEMADFGYFGHQSTVTGTWPNQLARQHGYQLPGFFADDANNIESLYGGSSDPLRVLSSFARSSSHRKHIFAVGDFFAAHTEFGVGRSSSQNYWAVHTAYADRSTRFVTGAVFDDGDGDGFLSHGEGLGGVVVGIGDRETVTDAGGVYSIAVPSGSHRVTVGDQVAAVAVGDYNVWVDFAVGTSVPIVRSYALCNGIPPTILGTNGSDSITATAGRDVIHGLGGSDTIVGAGADDVVCTDSDTADQPIGAVEASVRLAGVDRFDTAASVARASYPGGSEVVYLALGDNFPDALAAGPAAAAAGAPILLVHRDSVPDATVTELRRLAPTRVVVLGGTSSISGRVVSEVQRLVPDATVSRLAGPTRFETAVEVSRASFAPGVEVVYITNGWNFPDALVAGPAAFAAGGPLLLVEPGQIPGAVAKELDRLRPERIVIVGSPATVSADVAAELRQYTDSVVRVAGSSRFETAVEVSRLAFPAGAPVVYLAVGTDFPDALAGGSALGSGFGTGPILLVHTDAVPAVVVAELRRLDPQRVVILGGPAAVSAQVEATALASVR